MGAEGHAPPPKILEKIFLAQLLCKIWAFFGKESCKMGAFFNFFHTFFSGKTVLPPKVDWAPTPMLILYHCTANRDFWSGSICYIITSAGVNPVRVRASTSHDVNPFSLLSRSAAVSSTRSRVMGRLKLQDRKIAASLGKWWTET